MAIATAVDPVDMNGIVIFEMDFDTSTISSAAIQQRGFDGQHIVYNGSGFAFNDMTFEVTAGTVTSISSMGGVYPEYPDFTITGLNRSAVTIWDFEQASNGQ